MFTERGSPGGSIGFAFDQTLVSAGRGASEAVGGRADRCEPVLVNGWHPECVPTARVKRQGLGQGQ